MIKGSGYGKKIGFPTINLSRRNFLGIKKKPAFGVYAGQVILSRKPHSRASSLRGKKYKAGIVIGPLDKQNLPKIEAHLIRFNGDAYGQKAIFEINEFIRKFKKFKSEKNLMAQIKKDLKICSRV